MRRPEARASFFSDEGLGLELARQADAALALEGPHQFMHGGSREIRVHRHMSGRFAGYGESVAIS